ncbi:MAG: GNAT family N-acetyltransferase [Cyanobacteria bacterium TGS_CYA1]|nr:GNAT family N-acetyltransferase [Cyanobacteria bacterium TGS_CYA1]
MPRIVQNISETFLVEAEKQWRSSRHFVSIEFEDSLKAMIASSNYLTKNRTGEHKWLFGIKHLDWDSRHFGLKMGKIFPFIIPEVSPHDHDFLVAGNILLTEFLKKASQAQYQYLSVLVHPEDTIGNHLLSTAHFELMDTSILYSLKIKKLATRCNKNIELRLATQEDMVELQSISETCFGSRSHNVNRFNSDIFLEQGKVKDLYRQWIYNSFAKRGMADLVFVAVYNGTLAGFLTVKKNVTEKSAEIPLNAVLPNFRGQGVYQSLVECATSYLEERSYRTVEIWTHISNLAVQRTWQKLGAKPKMVAHQYRKYFGETL